MSDIDQFLEKNKQRWNELVGHHVAGTYYDLESFKRGRSTISDLDKELLGDITGKKVLHLQCHFGMDSISLIREGAAEVVGVDFSEEAIKMGRKLARELDANVRFVHTDVLKLDQVFDEFESFDLVYTSYGTIVWLPELRSWAKNIARYLKDGGRFVFIDGHPFSHIFDDEEPVDKLVPKYVYFHEGQAQHYNVEGSYGTSADITNKDEYLWPHSIGEILNSLASQDLVIREVREYTKVNWKMFPFLEREEDGWYHFPDGFQPTIPLLLGLIVEK